MNRKIFLPLCLLLVVLSTSPLFSGDTRQGTGKNFVMYIEDQYEYSPNAIRTRDGAYVSISPGETIRKISESGEVLWQKTVSAQLSNIQYTWVDGIADTDHGYIVVGSTWDWNDEPTPLIIMIGNDGIIQWSKTFESQEQLRFNSVSLTADGGYIVEGYSWDSRRTVLVKLTVNGDILWSKFFNDLLFCCTVSHPVSDGIILASTGTPSLILKVNDSGSIVWKKSLRIDGFYVSAMGSSSDNGVILAGRSFARAMLIRMSSDGKVEWNAAYRLRDPKFEISGVARTSDGGYVMSGTKFYDENYENPGGFVIKIDSKQQLVFHKKFGRSDRKEYAGQIFPTAEGGYVIFGRSQGENGLHALFLNVNSEGIVPGCGFFDQFNVRKASSPVIESRNREMTSRNFALTAHSIDVTLPVSTNVSSTTCP